MDRDAVRQIAGKIPGLRWAYRTAQCVGQAVRARRAAGREGTAGAPDIVIPPGHADDRPSPATVEHIAALTASNRASRAPLTDPSTPVTVTMTTYGTRADRCWLALESIASGTLLPARLVLWIERPMLRPLPRPLRRLRRRGLEIRRIPKRYGVHSKWVYVAREQSAEPVVTSDDDILYPPEWLAGLWAHHARHPGAVIAFRAYGMELAGGVVAPYGSWSLCTSDEPNLGNFGTSVSGQLFPRAVFDAAARDDTFVTCAPTADDIWLHSRAAYLGIGTAQVAPAAQLFPFIPGSQSDGLYLHNGLGRANDVQILAAYDVDTLAAITRDQAASRGQGAPDVAPGGTRGS